MRTLALLLLTAALAWGQAPAPAGAPAVATAPASVEALVDAALAFAKKEAEASGGTYRFKVVQPPHLPPLPRFNPLSRRMKQNQ